MMASGNARDACQWSRRLGEDLLPHPCHTPRERVHGRVRDFDARNVDSGHSRTTLYKFASMRVFDIPLAPPDHTWAVSIPNGERRQFGARHEAVVYAAKVAAQIDTMSGGAYLSIEGEDGKWRLFTPDLKAPL